MINSSSSAPILLRMEPSVMRRIALRATHKREFYNTCQQIVNIEDLNVPLIVIANSLQDI